MSMMKSSHSNELGYGGAAGMTCESDDHSHTNDNIRRPRQSMVNWEQFSVDGSSQGFDPDSSGYGAAGQTPQSKVEQEREFVEQMAKRESRNVAFSRGIVALVLVVTATLVTSMTYIFLHRKDMDAFENAFYQYALTIKDSTEFNLRGLIEATNGISQVFTSEAIQTNSTWPFMTLSSFEVYVRNTRAQGASELIVIAPIVHDNQIEEWNDYSSTHQGWIDESFQEYDQGRLDLNPIPSSVYRFGRFKGRTVLKPEDGQGGYPAAPFWQMSRPPFDTSIVNFNSLSTEENQATYDAMIATKHWVMGKAGPNTLIEYTHSEEAHDELHYAAERAKNTTGFANDHPHTALVYPVYRDKDSSHPTGNDVHSPIVAMIMNIIPWDNYLKRLLPQAVNGIHCVLQNSAGQAFTYRIDGSDAEYLGPGDLHEIEFDDQEFKISFADFLGKPSEYIRGGNVTNATATTEEAAAQGDGNLQYWFLIYPSKELQSAYKTNLPEIFTAVVAFIFVFMALTFFVYDRFVISKNNKIMDAATQSNAILASLFPQNVKERLLEDKADEMKADEQKRKTKRGFKNFSSGMDASLEDYFNNQGADMDDSGEEILSSAPIADLFPDATVMFADLVGFTAWSSTREPTQVFVLLETLYRNFDIIARRRRVYKVETIGDCYVAVTGCPTPRSDHHVAMCRFSIECLRRMRQLTKKLESRLGPDTSNLNMRFGLHSGPVTGGVLRGERSRFQLFGDTMNVAARMESNGQPGRVHLSGETADLLVASGKGRWLKKREDKIVAKGKGELQTWWLGKTSGAGSTLGSSDESHCSESEGDTSETSDDVNVVDVGEMGVLHMNSKTQRLVDWTVQSLMNLLDRLAGSREQTEDSTESKLAVGRGNIPVEEIEEVIKFQRQSCEQQKNNLVLEQRIEDQLEMYVGTIATLYPADNAFHNFEHASHVTMTMLKLISSVKTETNNGSLGFSSDLLAVFACAFGALIHDVQHPGVPNFQLKEENPALAAKFKSRSIAEQNSFTVAWDLLSEDRFKDLRNVIYRNESESTRFRHLVIQAVMATDLFDKDNAKFREDRWRKAFDATAMGEESPIQVLDRKDTLVLEHLTMAADISHTMQHWEIYRKWNTLLFEEMYAAYKSGRAEKDPSSTWYGGEIWFFDNHVIPLATKIQQFGCFGLMGEDLLKHAEDNRREWEEKGRQIVAGMLEAVNGDGKTLLADAAEVEQSHKEVQPKVIGEAQVSFGESPADGTGASEHWRDEALENEELTDLVDV